MQFSMRASVLQAALGQAAGARVRVDRPTPGTVRLSVPAPVEGDRWADVLGIVQEARAWGSTDATGEVRVWMDVEEP